MISFFKNRKESTIDNNNFLTKIASLLVHAAKIDEVYTDQEEEIIKKTLIKLGAKNSEINQIMSEAAVYEENSNQILDFTKEVKKMPEEDKIKIIEALWQIIYSNKNADIYEVNLMRRLAGLLYIDSRTMGDVKEKVKKEFL
jgi:uncharacterized tellurite resistance protein B-like protein